MYEDGIDKHSDSFRRRGAKGGVGKRGCPPPSLPGHMLYHSRVSLVTRIDACSSTRMET